MKAKDTRSTVTTRDLHRYYSPGLTQKEWNLLREGLVHGFLQVDEEGIIVLQSSASMVTILRYGSLHTRQLNSVDLWNVANSR